MAVLGTGVNPGFVLDRLPAFFGHVVQRVRHVRALRVVDAATRALPGGVALVNGCRRYCVTVVYDLRGDRAGTDYRPYLRTDAAALSSLKPVLVFSRHGRYPEILLTALFPMTTLPGARTPLSVRRTVHVRLKNTRERAARLGQIPAPEPDSPTKRRKK